MSLVTTYVFATDGQLYREPIYEKPGDWFVCFDDTDPVELCIRHDGHKLVAAPQAVLREIGLPVVALRRAQGGYHKRQFGEALQTARSWWVELGPGPLPIPHRHDGVVTGAPAGVIYGKPEAP